MIQVLQLRKKKTIKASMKKPRKFRSTENSNLPFLQVNSELVSERLTATADIQFYTRSYLFPFFPLTP